ncbi:unnamed protein product [Miscanthus lutarioriparius]|uniref:RING-type domain-containing protein n=1 Tax=Miscanthus lutarioriparius TaxID=422564 RepID=A0A811QSX8_9POAL|nr:unnamed protein product [Miscanthus lutarioriparius]
MSPITGYRSAASSSSLTIVGERRSPVQAPRLGADDYPSLDEVAKFLHEGGLENLNLILGFDFTRSNTWNGQNSFNGRSLHAIGPTPNPYAQVIKIIGEASSNFYEHPDISIQCFGFGDESTRDKDVFCFNLNERPCHGYREALDRYKELVPHLKFAGPTSFAPLIEMAMTVVERSGGRHHVLLIIADGQEAVRIDNESGQVTVQDRKTIDAIASASNFPLSIILVGVGDDPWDMMQGFDDAIPMRAFNNFQFVNFSEIMSRETAKSRNEAALAFEVFSKVPLQFKAAMELGISGRNLPVSPGRAPRAPPDEVIPRTPGASSDRSESFGKTSADEEDLLLSLSHVLESDGADLATTTNTLSYQNCPICLTNLMDMAFGCGHMFCGDCGTELERCPFCRSPVTTKITLHQQDVCPVCLGDTKDMALNCGHQTCCACGPNLESCRKCGDPITERIKLY